MGKKYRITTPAYKNMGSSNSILQGDIIELEEVEEVKEQALSDKLFKSWREASNSIDWIHGDAEKIAHQHYLDRFNKFALGGLSSCDYDRTYKAVFGEEGQ